MDRTIQHCTKKCQKGYESALFCYYPNKDRHAEATIKCSFNLLCIMSLHKTPLQEIVCASNVQCPGSPRSLLGKRELVSTSLRLQAQTERRPERAPRRDRGLPRACLKNHFRNLQAPLCGIFYPHSVAVARYAALIRIKSPTN